MTFDNPATEISALLDIHEHYKSKAEAVRDKENFKPADIERYQLLSALSEAAKDVAEMVKEGGY